MIALLFKPHLDEARIKAEFDAILQEQRQARIDAGLAIHGARAHVPPHRVRGSGSATSRAGLTEDEWKEEEENENENEEASSMGHMDFYKVLETRSVGDSWVLVGTHGHRAHWTLCTRPAVRTRACSRLPFRLRTATHARPWLGLARSWL